MSQQERRRGFSPPQRSPKELADTLAELAAATDEPRPRPRRPIPPSDHAAKDVLWSTPAETLPERRDPVVAEALTDTAVPTADDPLREQPAAMPADAPKVVPEAPVEPPISPQALVEPTGTDLPPVPEAPVKPHASEVREAGARTGLVVGNPLDEGRAGLGDEPGALAAEARAARARPRSRAAGQIRYRDDRSLRGRLRPRARRRSQFGRPRSANGRANPRSQRTRRIYAVLIAILVIFGIIAIFDSGGTKNAHNSSAGAARSAFPPAGPTPTTASTPTVASTPTTSTRAAVAPPTKQSVASQGKRCRPLRVHGRTVNVHILHGNVTCRRARGILLAFEKGKPQGTGGASPDRTVLGWKCVPDGSCTRPGKSIKAS